jgi:hypothetical protein
MSQMSGREPSLVRAESVQNRADRYLFNARKASAFFIQSSRLSWSSVIPFV